MDDNRRFILETLEANLTLYKQELEKARQAAKDEKILESLVAETEAHIARLKGGGQLARTDIFAHVTLSRAVRIYLKKLGRPAKVSAEVLPSLVDGGALSQTGQEHRLRMIKQAITKKKEVFDYDPDSDTVSLRNSNNLDE